MDAFNDKEIIHSWKKNSKPWITAVHENQIESRIQVTNQSIINTVLSFNQKTVLDIGCGEGWLSRELSSLGHDVLGIDVNEELVSEAIKLGGGQFQVLAYEDISNKTISTSVDIAVCNFSLLGKESVDYIFKVIPSILADGGYFIIQTPHPVISCGQSIYKDGWCEGTWKGFDHTFTDPAPWYFRTIESWIELFEKNRLQIVQLKEPIFPSTGEIASLIIAGRVDS